MVQGSTPRYQQISQSLTRLIESGAYLPGQVIPSEQALCEQFSVSRITVRQALASLVQAGLLVKRPGVGTFVREATPKPVGGRTDGVISLILSNAGPADSFMSQLIRGVASVLRGTGFELNLVVTHDNLDEERACIEQLVARKAAGALLFTVDTPGPANPNCFQYMMIREAGIPILFVDRYLDQLPIGYVVTDDQDGMRTLTEHFISLGHESIGYMDHAVHVSSVKERYQGFVDAMTEHRLRPECVIKVDRPRGNESDMELGLAAMRDYLRSGQKLPTAMLACNSYYSIGIFRALKAAGKRVPEDVALAGFDDLPEATVLEVPLTVCRAPVEVMGARAAQELIGLIKQGLTGEEVRLRVPGKLVIRESCGGEIVAAAP
ncbi:MAG: GntR family transcriptional regulator [Planctomycetota bacterium]|nr:GntR family transcriptional regulator [Planctomycetota bacterium]